MKVSEYNQMMAYLTRKKPEKKAKGFDVEAPAKKFDDETKPKVREETMSERIQSMHHIYDGGPRPKHMDNKNIKSYEDMQTIKPFKKIKKISRPINIDISGINTDLNKLENIMNKTPEPVYNPPAEEENLEGLEKILGVKHPYKKY